MHAVIISHEWPHCMKRVLHHCCFQAAVHNLAVTWPLCLCVQVAFREQAAKLAEKYGVAGPAAHDSEQDDDDDDRDDVDVGDADSDDEDDDDEEEEELGSADGDDDDDEHGVADEDEAASLGDGGSHDGGEEDEQQQQQQRGRTLDAALPDQGAAALQQRRAAGAAASTSAPATVDTSNKHQKPSGRHITATADEAPLDLPYTIPLPDSYAAFAKLVNGRPAEQLALAVQRIRMFNAAALATDSKRKLQVRAHSVVTGVALDLLYCFAWLYLQLTACW